MTLEFEVAWMSAQHGEDRTDSTVFASAHSRRRSSHNVQQRVAGGPVLVGMAWASQHRQHCLDGSSTARLESIFIGGAY
jgi:hypothetical protein